MARLTSTKLVLKPVPGKQAKGKKKKKFYASQFKTLKR